MKAPIRAIAGGVLLAWAGLSGTALACDPEFDGCLGCNDTELPVCINSVVERICQNGGGGPSCDTREAWDDVEKLVLRSMGMHMARMRSLERSASRYKHVQKRSR